jgi:predicted transposase YbfD/YdcC
MKFNRRSILSLVVACIATVTILAIGAQTSLFTKDAKQKAEALLKHTHSSVAARLGPPASSGEVANS